MSNKSKVIIACDFPSKKELINFVDQFPQGESLFLKLGMQIIYKEGFGLIEEMKQRGHRIFLDLKVHDIPVTVANAINSIKHHDVELFTLHSLGGFDMMKASAEAMKPYKTNLLAVTILTSMDQEDLNDINISVPVEEEVKALMDLTKESGVQGVVCSGYEAAFAKERGLISIVPGIRLEENSKHDQKRVMTPERAIANGATYIVMGRAITQADNPAEVYKSVNERIENYERSC